MDADGILKLYDRHARELLRFFAGRTGDPQVALDLVSETFLAAFEHRADCRARTGSQAAAWLHRIAVNQLAGHYRRGASERRATDRLRDLTAAEVAEIDRLVAAEEPGRLTVALNGLSDEQRRAVQARVIDELPYASVSQVLGVSQPAARARVSRGLRALRRAAGSDAERSDG